MLVVAGVLAVVLTNRGGKSPAVATSQVALQPVAATGPDPFTGSVAAGSAVPSAVGSLPGTPSAGAERTVQGSQVGLYGGSGRTGACDVPKLSDFLTSPGNEAKARAWAGVEGIDPGTVDAYLHSLTPVVLRADTRVTNHGYRNGVASPFQAVLQSGTAVLVDTRGLPRVRCACGNPLLPPAALTGAPAFTGTPWPDFKDRDVVVVSPAPSPVQRIVVVDPSSGESVSTPLKGASGSSSASGSSGSASGSASASSSGSASGSATRSHGASSGTGGSSKASQPSAGEGSSASGQ